MRNLHKPGYLTSVFELHATQVRSSKPSMIGTIA